jgi:hypothetical protein
MFDDLSLTVSGYSGMSSISQTWAPASSALCFRSTEPSGSSTPEYADCAMFNGSGSFTLPSGFPVTGTFAVTGSGAVAGISPSGVGVRALLVQGSSLQLADKVVATVSGGTATVSARLEGSTLYVGARDFSNGATKARVDLRGLGSVSVAVNGYPTSTFTVSGGVTSVCLSPSGSATAC